MDGKHGNKVGWKEKGEFYVLKFASFRQSYVVPPVSCGKYPSPSIITPAGKCVGNGTPQGIVDCLKLQYTARRGGEVFHMQGTSVVWPQTVFKNMLTNPDESPDLFSSLLITVSVDSVNLLHVLFGKVVKAPFKHAAFPRSQWWKQIYFNFCPAQPPVSFDVLNVCVFLFLHIKK